MDDTLIITNKHETQISATYPKVVVGLQCGLAVLRGSHVYAAGLMGVPSGDLYLISNLFIHQILFARVKTRLQGFCFCRPSRAMQKRPQSGIHRTSSFCWKWHSSPKQSQLVWTKYAQVSMPKSKLSFIFSYIDMPFLVGLLWRYLNPSLTAQVWAISLKTLQSMEFNLVSFKICLRSFVVMY